jgi:hypothetical protein
MNLLFESIKNFTSLDRFSQMLDSLICSKTEFICASNSCMNCSDFSQLFYDLFMLDTNELRFNISQWSKCDTGFIQKHAISNQTFEQIHTIFDENFEFYKIHQYLIKVQQECIQELKNTQNDDEVIIFMDYSENYTTTSQREVQSAYYAKKQIGLFTAISYVGQREPVSYLFINDNISHGKEQIYHYKKIIINEVKSEQPNLKHITFVSDGAASQFKNKFMLSNLLYTEQDFQCTGEWIFFPTSHGKNAVDGIGGTFKRNVYNRVLSGQFQVYSAKEFYECALQFANKTKLFYVEQTDVQKTYDNTLVERWTNVKPIPKTRSFHYFTHSADRKSLIACISARRDGTKVIKVLND